MVKNEIDIIETFIRYHVLLLNGMVILDNGSSDGTVEVINKLINEGLPIYLIFDDNPSYDQSSIMTKMLYISLRHFKPDYILPLDADEFLVSSSDQPISSLLKKQLNQDSLFFLSWITYVPTEKDIAKELNPLKRITHRREIQNNYDKKVIIPANIALKHSVVIKQGNHNLEGVPKGVLKETDLKNLSLAHFPIRSEDQAKSKYLVGWLANLARDEQVLFDWYYYYNILKEGLKLTSKDLERLALQYGIPNKRISIGLVEDPVQLSKVQNFKLKYTSKNDIQYVKNILNYTETLARKYSNLLKKTKKDGGENTSNNSYDDQMILQIIKDYFLIDGWLSIREAVGLYKLVQLVKGNNVTVCEIGSWLGKSSYILARSLERHENGRLICIDPFNATGDNRSKKIYKHTEKKLKKSLLKTFTDNMRRFGVLNQISTIQGYSHEIIKEFNTPIDILFIDGDHDYNSVLRDYKDWSKLVKKGGFIAFHDVGGSHVTGPKEVVELEIADNPDWIDHTLIDELYIARKNI